MIPRACRRQFRVRHTENAARAIGTAKRGHRLFAGAMCWNHEAYTEILKGADRSRDLGAVCVHEMKAADRPIGSLVQKAPSVLDNCLHAGMCAPTDHEDRVWQDDHHGMFRRLAVEYPGGEDARCQLHRLFPHHNQLRTLAIEIPDQMLGERFVDHNGHSWVQLQDGMQPPDVISVRMGEEQQVDGGWLDSEGGHVPEQYTSIAAGIEQDGPLRHLENRRESPQVLKTWKAGVVVEQDGHARRNCHFRILPLYQHSLGYG